MQLIALGYLLPSYPSLYGVTPFSLLSPYPFSPLSLYPSGYLSTMNPARLLL